MHNSVAATAAWRRWLLNTRGIRECVKSQLGAADVPLRRLWWAKKTSCGPLYRYHCNWEMAFKHILSVNAKGHKSTTTPDHAALDSSLFVGNASGSANASYVTDWRGKMEAGWSVVTHGFRLAPWWKDKVLITEPQQIRNISTQSLSAAGPRHTAASCLRPSVS